MKVILTQDVKGQGKKDQMVEVSDGYARNFLLPKKLAIPADAKSINEMKNKEASKQHKIDVEKQNAIDIAKKLEEIVLVFEYSAGPDKKLYGSVTNKDISEELAKKHGIAIDKKKISLPVPIKSYGRFSANAQLFSGIVGKISVEVTSKK
ncbi:MAG: 50S ribosomal protein L9 [Clostridia bacterium]|nr:50S ribosomal protein L9 [Clostridia bacterium]MBO7250091.1 50S ribosomal protein L9 [Clostridia bacterium]